MFLGFPPLTPSRVPDSALPQLLGAGHQPEPHQPQELPKNGQGPGGGGRGRGREAVHLHPQAGGPVFPRGAAAPAQVRGKPCAFPLRPAIRAPRFPLTPVLFLPGCLQQLGGPALPPGHWSQHGEGGEDGPRHDQSLYFDGF